ncbi:hypothetical protein CGGC5_v012529 [Colletotrichum fructicola Nara gc5]|uniref:Uncharacterized protein n=1 Tax=Colletotrichum fructicola (strain Nara gc5) TaxID=1213859 RepID=A0A7J6IRQ1_COLFN|nr:hypothetical protein CGGC5_v012529 [Colletotrichum fructicola Nara gc5]
MGNQPSKEGGHASGKGAGGERTAEDLKSYPSFGRSDTKDSSRSFKALRSKIPGSSNKTDSPRNSVIASPADEKADASSVKSAAPVSNPV